MLNLVASARSHTIDMLNDRIVNGIISDGRRRLRKAAYREARKEVLSANAERFLSSNVIERLLLWPRLWWQIKRRAREIESRASKSSIF